MNIGIVDWFGGKKDYGFIKPLNFSKSVNNFSRDIFVHRKKILEASKNLSPNDIVVFEVQSTFKGLEAINVKLATAENLIELINFADAEDYKNFRTNFKFSKPSLFKETLAAIPQDLLKKYSWLREDLPTVKRLNLCVEMYKENSTPALLVEISNLLDAVTTFDWKILPPEFFNNEKIVRKISANITAEEEFEEFSSRIPKEMALSLELWTNFTPQIKLIIFKKYLNEFGVDELILKINELAKLHPASEITKIILASDNRTEIISICLNRKTTDTNIWIPILTEDIALLEKVKATEDALIFIMYKAAKNDKFSAELVEILENKIFNANNFYRAKIVYAYFRAGVEKIYGNSTTSRQFLNKANDYISDMFNLLADNPDDFSILPEILNDGAFVFPPCTNSAATKRFERENKIIPCHFCEAVTWWTRKKTIYEIDEHGEICIDKKTGKEIIREIKPDPCNYCPRLGIADDSQTLKEKNCCRINPNLNLPAKEWSLVELVEKFRLEIFDSDRYNKEFFTRIGGEFNRLYELREHLKCRTCGEYMRSVKFAYWKKVKNLWRETFDHFAVFASTTFQCQNPDCNDNEIVYLSYCWHCKNIVDSRDCHKKIKGYYLCERCGAGYKDSVDPAWRCEVCGGHDSWVKNSKDGAKIHCNFCGNEEPASFYAIFPATLCPSCLNCDNCGGEEFNILELAEPTAKLQCKKCGKEMLAPVTIEKDKDSESSKKFKCSKCGRELQMEVNHLNWQVQQNSLKKIHWAGEKFKN